MIIWSFFPGFLHIFVSPNNDIPLEVFDVHPQKKFIYLIFISVGVLLSEFVVLYLLEYMMRLVNRSQFAMLTINLLLIHIVYCKNLQLKMW